MHPTQQAASRRDFLKAATLAAMGTSFAAKAAAAEATPPRKLFSAMGIAASLDRAAALKALGAEFLTEGVGGFLVPDQPAEAFAKNLAKLAAAPLPVLACNGFIRPANLRCVGADANPDKVLAWAEVAFRRLQQVGGKFIVFGSAGARALRAGWTKEQADIQFIALLKRMGPLAQQHDIIVAVEQLQASECNYLNRIGETAAVLRAAGHPHIRLLADLYHMARMGDTPADLKAAMDVVVHVEIAEKEERTVPGVHGDDFRPFFRVLREAGYQGTISIEGKGTNPQIGAAFQEIARQAAEV
jgi:sugar phosphate isomerase/epimerase